MAAPSPSRLLDAIFGMDEEAGDALELYVHRLRKSSRPATPPS
jgi:hypothetical protein